MFSRFIKKLTHSEKKTTQHPKKEPAQSPVAHPSQKNTVRNIATQTKHFIKDRTGWSLFILFVLTFLISTQVRSFVYVVLFIAIAAMSKLLQMITPPSFILGADFVSPLLVIMTVAYGPFVGITTCLIAYYIGTILLTSFGRRSDPAVWIIPPVAYTLTGMAISLLHYGFPAIGYTSMFLYAGSVTVMFALYY
jgi:hypothetical protein